MGAGPCIFVKRSISSYNRDRLIKAGISFIVPGNQMYVPDFGIDLREFFLKTKKASKEYLNPSTQAIVIFALLNKCDKKFFTIELSQHLNYRIMTINRAFDELKAASIGEVLVQGRKRYWIFSGSKRELWEAAKMKLRSPIQAHLWISNVKAIEKSKPLAGLSALAQYSNLNEPPIPVYATISLLRDPSINPKNILRTTEGAEGELEVWRYDPNLFQQHGKVDPFSLYLSLQEMKDERIEAALEEMMEKIKW